MVDTRTVLCHNFYMKRYYITYEAPDGKIHGGVDTLEAADMRELVLMFWQMWFYTWQPVWVKFEEA